MPSPHDAFKALGPVNWDYAANSDLDGFLRDAFSNAQTLVESIPPASGSALRPPQATVRSRSRAQTDSMVPLAEITKSLSSKQTKPCEPAAADLQKEWKEVKISAKDNPMDVNVYKLAAKDGKGSWFARRSVHGGLSFDKWKLGLEREFKETMKVQGPPGSGNVRGIGAERVVEHRVVDDVGKLEVYQLSAQFPGPTAPRDFITLMLSSASPNTYKHEGGVNSNYRQFMSVSKPCVHPDCPNRQGFIRGQYESVEVIREIPVERPLRRTRSSIDLTSDDVERAELSKLAGNLGRDAMIRSATKLTSDKNFAGNLGESGDEKGTDDETMVMIEWIMITRSDPGGSVPRFMVEKGTPSGIVSDAGRFLKWINSKEPEDFAPSEDNNFKQEAVAEEEKKRDSLERQSLEGEGAAGPVVQPLIPESPAQQSEESTPSGFYGMIAGALGAAGSVVSARISQLPFHASTKSNDVFEQEEPSSLNDDTSSISSYASAQEPPPASPSTIAEPDEIRGPESIRSVGAVSNMSDGSSTLKAADSTPISTTASGSSAQREKELKKLEERRRKLEEKLAKAQETAAARFNDEREKDAAAQAKQREKHERDLARQEEKYQRELRRLEERRVTEQRRQEERRRKQAEREEKARLAIDLERVTVERDVAVGQLALLRDQVGELQAQNTMLVARMGKLGGLGTSVGSGPGIGLSNKDTDPWDSLRKSTGGEPVVDTVQT